jgi:hypothetical protein
MTGSYSTGHPRAPGTETYLDYTSNRDIDFDRIKSDMTCTKFHDSVWGFVVPYTSSSLSPSDDSAKVRHVDAQSLDISVF